MHYKVLHKDLFHFTSFTIAFIFWNRFSSVKIHPNKHYHVDDACYDSDKPGLQGPQLPLERSVTLVSSIVVERRCWATNVTLLSTGSWGSCKPCYKLQTQSRRYHNINWILIFLFFLLISVQWKQLVSCRENARIKRSVSNLNRVTGAENDVDAVRNSKFSW